MNKIISLDSLQRLIIAPLKKLIDKKVEKVDGKDLSTNDFTNEDKEKLAGIERYIEEQIGSIEGFATESYVDSKVTDLVNYATENIDTLDELSSALQENEEAIDALNAAITNKLDKPKDDELTEDDNGKVIGVVNSAYELINANDHNHTSAQITSVKDTAIQWSDIGLSGILSPVDEAASTLHSANRLAFANPEGITIEYSNDAGVTWAEYSTNDENKMKLVSGIGQNYSIGMKSTGITLNDQLRITLDATAMGVYTKANKLLINLTTNGASGCKVKVEKSYKGNVATFGTQGIYDVSGWSGWNSIPFSGAFGGGATQSSNVAVLRLTFTLGSLSDSYTNILQVIDIVMLGGTYWSVPSDMAKTGHLYSYDVSKNATFPANITANKFIGTATKATQDADGKVITETYAKIDELNALKARVSELENILNSNVYLVTNG